VGVSCQYISKNILNAWKLLLCDGFCVCSKYFCTLRYIVRQRVYVIYDAIIYSKRPLLRLRPLPSNNELSAAKAHSILHHHPSLLHRHTLIFDRLLTFVVAFSVLVLSFTILWLYFSQSLSPSIKFFWLISWNYDHLLFDSHWLCSIGRLSAAD